ncbi:hypothetical protein Xoosp13_312 [Xanthomonas phage Xoo-sp13]|nr:hypothetical protein Xoosp13_312 [Xanthomonas phage Xoo-sp13]
MNKFSDVELRELIRKVFPAKIANDLVNVQPINTDAYAGLIKNGLTEEELIAQGYEPVSSTGLLWIKKGTSDE